MQAADITMQLYMALFWQIVRHRGSFSQMQLTESETSCPVLTEFIMRNVSEAKNKPPGSNALENKGELTVGPPANMFKRIAIRVYEMIRTEYDRKSKTKRLVDLNERILNDIGLRREEARKEFRMHFWIAGLGCPVIFV